MMLKKSLLLKDVYTKTELKRFLRFRIVINLLIKKELFKK